MAISLGTSPALNGICGGADTAKPVKDPHPKQVEDADQNPSPHVPNDTPRSSCCHRGIHGHGVSDSRLRQRSQRHSEPLSDRDRIVVGIETDAHFCTTVRVSGVGLKPWPTITPCTIVPPGFGCWATTR